MYVRGKCLVYKRSIMLIEQDKIGGKLVTATTEHQGRQRSHLINANSDY